MRKWYHAENSSQTRELPNVKIRDARRREGGEEGEAKIMS